MASKIKQKLVAQGLVTAGCLSLEGLHPTPNTGVALQTFDAKIQRARFKVTALVAPVLAANDYGSIKLCDLPNTTLLMVGCIVDLNASVTGTGSVLANVDLAVGTVATASTTFSNAGEKNLNAKIDCTSGGVIDGTSVAAETNVNIAAGASNSIYLNVATGNITTDGGVTLDGFVDILFIDLGKPT